MKCVFEEVVGKVVRRDARVDVVGLADGGQEVLGFLNADCMVSFLSFLLSFFLSSSVLLASCILHSSPT